MYWLPYHSFLLESPHSKEEVTGHVKQMAIAPEKLHLYSDYFSPDKTHFRPEQFTLKEYFGLRSRLWFNLSWQISVSYLSCIGQWKHRYKVTLGYSIIDYFIFGLLLAIFTFPLFFYPEWERLVWVLLFAVSLLFLPILLSFNWKASKMKKYILQVLNARECSF